MLKFRSIRSRSNSIGDKLGIDITIKSRIGTGNFVKLMFPPK